MQEPYTTPAMRATAEYVEKKSRFLATVLPIESEAQALAFLAEMRNTYPDARHQVYAYRLMENHTTRYSDDGEPQGTAGVPVLDVLQKSQIQNVACVVVRYFGGILLGANGLVRAYTTAAKEALQAAGKRTYRLCSVGMVTCPYPLYQRWLRELPQRGAVILDTHFDAAVTLQLSIEKEQYASLCAWIAESSAGSVSLQFTEDRWLS